MERKRKLPARAAARAEQAAKRRTMTPPQRSATPVSVVEGEPTPVEDAPPPLPKSITAGKPLPTVDSPQPDDLSSNEYQSVTESGVLADSLVRSRLKWTVEGIFEKYWSKPVKRKGVVIEEPNNPPKESMTKLGPVTITVEPHVFEVIMYGVKDPKPAPPPPPTSERPILQYGPPNGVMPPPPTPNVATPTTATTPAPAPAPTQPQAHAPAQPAPTTKAPAQTPTQTPTQPQAQPATTAQPKPDMSRSAPTVATAVPRLPAASPRGMGSVLSPSTVSPLIPPSSPAAQPPLPRPTPPPISTMPTGTTPVATTAPPRPAAPNTTISNPPVNTTPSAPSTPALGRPGPGTDPIILTLAEKAGVDPQLRDLMKRVAHGEAAKHELERFQAIIDAITAESRQKGNGAGPSADKLLVDGMTVKFIAEEVRTILDIVLSSNPKQTSADLQAPAGSNPLVVMVVKAALDDQKTRDMVRRIAENKPQFSDATDLKAVVDRLRAKLKGQPQQAQPPASSPAPPSKPSGAPNSHTPSSSTPSTPQAPIPQQALRSKGPPPAPKPDISAVVFEFTGGSGDRYLFPKFSLLEYVPVPTGQQVIVSFLLVRKGSKAEYPMADPDLDYYQPLTIRLFTHTGRHLEHLARVVAPPDEVRRYMDDVMSRMTRAEYILLAMRLPRAEGADGAEEKESQKEKEKDKAKDRDKEGQTNGAATKEKESRAEKTEPLRAVLWATQPPKPEMRDLPPGSKGYGRVMDADEQYQSFIASVSRKEGT